MEVIIDGVVYVPKEKPKEEYPIFKVNEEREVFRFDNQYEGIQVFGTNLHNLINPMHHSLETIPYNKERGLYHKQPVWCWLNNDKYGRSIRFYNYHKDELISPCDSNYSHGFQNIEPITPDQLKVMPFIWEMYKQLED